MPVYAIITGDIVSSRTIEARKREKLYDDMNVFLRSMKRKWIKTYEIFRGDSIQCEVNSPKTALRAALIIRSYVMSYTPEDVKRKLRQLQKNGRQTKGYLNVKFDIRVAIGIGKIDFIKNKITRSDGEAFQLSGEGLDDLKDDYQRLIIKTDNTGLNRSLEPVVSLLDALIQKWTQNQAEYVFYKLQNKKDEQIAQLFDISLSAANQRKRTAQWSAIEKAVGYFENEIGLK